jgi:hypothetical protein
MIHYDNYYVIQVSRNLIGFCFARNVQYRAEPVVEITIRRIRNEWICRFFGILNGRYREKNEIAVVFPLAACKPLENFRPIKKSDYGTLHSLLRQH